MTRYGVVLALALALVLGACGGDGAESDTTESPTTVAIAARCTELRADFERMVDELGGVETAMGRFEEVPEREAMLEVGVVADYTSPSDPPIEFMLEVETEFVFELASGKLYVATFPEVWDVYNDLMDERCDLGWFAVLTEPFRETASGTGRVVEPLSEW